MATTKTKGTSKKIKELKGVKPEKVSKEELTNIQMLVGRINQLYSEVGRLESQKHNQLHALAGSNDEMMVLQEKLMKEYNTTDINIQDGTINYEDDVKADS
jgi:hypothetical protein